MVRADTSAVVSHLKPVGHLEGSRHLRLAISLPLRNQQELAAFLAQLQDPASPNYHKYLTPAQFADRFGPSKQDYNALAAFAQAHRLTVTRRHPNRMILDVDGAVSDIEKALHVKMQVYQHPLEARQFYAPDTDPTVKIAASVLKISGLDDYSLPHANYQIRPPGARAAIAGNAGSGPGGTYSGYDFRDAYAPGVTLTGTGQTLGLLEFDGYYSSDIAYYENYTGLPNVPLTNVLLDGFNGTPSGDGAEVEVSLDIEVAIAMAPGLSKILVYEAGPNGNWHDILNQMADDNLAKQMSCSWYSPGQAADPIADQIFQQMAAQGQSFFCACGDYDAYTSLIPFPCDSPYVTQVGGTTLTTPGPKSPYGSETVWNWGYDSEAGTYIGSGGGISTQYAIPTWQQGIGMTANMGSTTMRNVPDVAMTADNVYVQVDGGSYSVGGTSCAAPLWAGFTALINQEAVANAKSTVGFINPAVYAICTGTGYGTAFHDITAGNNFSASSPSQFPAEPGYDLCTGCGTPSGIGLIYALAGPPAPIISTASPLPNGEVGAAYSQALMASGGVAPYVWSVSAGSLPAGLTFSSSGVLSGTPSASGTASFTVQVAGSNGDSSTAVFGLTIYPAGTPIIVTASPLPTGMLGTAYNQAFAASGGATPYTWSIFSGSLPGGVAMSSAGLLSGTPTTTGTFSFTAQVTGSDGLASTSPFILLVPPPPVITSGSAATGLVAEAFGYQIIATNNPTSYNATGLPAGLAVNPSTGLISGTPTSTGTTAASISAANGGGTASAPLTITVLPGPPVITSALNVTATSGVPFSYQITAANGPASFAVDGLNYPSGVAVSGDNLLVTSQEGNIIGEYNAATGVAINPNFITGLSHPANVAIYGGNLFVANQYSASVGEYNPITGATINASFITGASLCNGLAIAANGTAYVSQDGYGTVGEYASTGTPINASFISGLSGPGQVLLSGSALFVAHTANGLVGEYNAATGAAINADFITSVSQPNGLALSGDNLYVTDLETNTIGVFNVSTGAAINTTFVTGLNNPGYMTVSGSNLYVSNSVPGSGWVAVYNATTGAAINTDFITGLPPGLSFNTVTGVISGTPTTGGTGSVTISAASASGTGSATLTITILGGPPVITSAPAAAGTAGAAFSYQITASNNPTSYGASGLPAGLTVNSTTGQISGTATSSGTSNVIISAANASGTGAANLTITMALGIPQITSASSVEAVIGQPFSYQITATSLPAYYNATDLPEGLTLNPLTGLISGTPTLPGVATGTVSAANSAGTGSAPLTITVVTGPPAITSALGAQTIAGQPFSYQITATNAPTSYGASGLPAGLSVSATSGLISGTPASSGSSNVTISAANVSGSGTATLVMIVVPPAPVITSSLTATGNVGVAFTYDITATNGPTGYSAAGLPAGLAVTPSTGVISGTPASTGTTYAVISASNAGGTQSAILTVIVLPGPPVITSALSVTATSGMPFTYQITASQPSTTYGAAGLNYPSGVAVSGDNLLVTSQVGNIIGEYNAATGAAINTNFITGLSHPANVATYGGNLYVANQYSASVGEYNPITGATINASFITGVSLCNGLAISSTGTTFVSQDGYSSIGKYSANGTAINSSFITGTPGPAEVLLSGTILYVAHSAYGVVGEYNANTGAAINANFITSVSQPNGLALSGDNLFVTDLGSYVVGEYNAATGAAITTNFITGLNNPGYLTVSGNNLYVSNCVGGTGGWVGVYNATTGAAIDPDFIGPLPPGLTLNTATGVISGTTTATGTCNVIIDAVGASGTASANLTITVLPAAPAITSAPNATGTNGMPFSYQIAASNDPTSYSASGLPAGLSVNTVTGMISGTAAVSGSCNAIISGSNAAGVGMAGLAITMQSSYASWQTQWFTPAQLANPAISGNMATPAGDGISNLMKYAFNLNPLANGLGALPTHSVMSIGGTNYLTLTYTVNIFATGITYVPQVSSNLENWFSGAGYILPVSVTPNADGVTETVVVQALAPIGPTPQFIRLKVTSP